MLQEGHIKKALKEKVIKLSRAGSHKPEGNLYSMKVNIFVIELTEMEFFMGQDIDDPPNISTS